MSPHCSLSMFFRLQIVAVLCTAFLANAAAVNNTVLARDDANMPVVVLLNDCPGASEGRSDACTFERGAAPQQTVYAYDSQTVRNCDPNSTPFTQTFRYGRSLTGMLSVTSNAEVNGIGGPPVPPGAKIDGLDTSLDHRVVQIVVKDAQVHANSQTVLLVQQAYMRQSGKVRVNYGKRMNGEWRDLPCANDSALNRLLTLAKGHYIWYVDDFNDDVPIWQGGGKASYRYFPCSVDVKGVIAGYNADFRKTQIA